MLLDAVGELHHHGKPCTGSGVVRRTLDGCIELLARPAATVLALFDDSRRHLIGTEGGFDRLRNGDAVPIGAPRGASSNPVMTVGEDCTGAMRISANEGESTVRRIARATARC